MRSLSFFQKFKYTVKPLLIKRRFHAYCIGHGKTGTHSLSDMFHSNYRATHEDDAEILLDLIMDVEIGKVSRDHCRNFLKWRDRRLLTEMDSSGLNVYLLEHFRDLFPQAKFILTIRDCYSWLDSQLNHIISRPPQNNPRVDYSRFQDFHYHWQGEAHPQEEQILKDYGLYTLDHFLAAYAWHNKTALTVIPKERLLVVRTHEIRRDAVRIAEFIGVPLETMNLDRSHSYPASQKLDILQQIDPDYLHEKIKLHCGALMDEWFPDFQVANNHQSITNPK